MKQTLLFHFGLFFFLFVKSLILHMFFNILKGFFLSCFSRAFTATECVESQWAIHNEHQTIKDLSVQELISCSPSQGCSGGNTLAALEWLQTKVSGDNEDIIPLHPNISMPML